jgi:hypothetical protein
MAAYEPDAELLGSLAALPLTGRTQPSEAC